MSSLYRISYYTGVQTMRVFHRIGRFFTLMFLPLRLLLWRAVRAVGRLRPPKRHREGLAGVRKRLKASVRLVREAGNRHPLLAVLQVLYLPIAAAKHYKALTRAVVTLTAMGCAVAVLLGTIQYWGKTTYALALTDEDGDVWGYVSDESVWQDGAAKAGERLGSVVYDSFSENAPALSLRMIRQAALWDKWEVCDHLLRNSDAVGDEACGIYIDGVFCGAVGTRRGGEQLLESILQESCEEQPGVTADFVETVELVEGWYPETVIQPTQTVKQQLTTDAVAEQRYVWQEGDTLSSVAKQHGISVSQLLQNNPTISKGVSAGQSVVIQKAEPHLRVLVSGTVQYETEIPYTVERVPDATLYEGRERIRVYGKNGISLVTATVTSLDGVEQFSAITSSEVVKEPVTQVVAYGTKKTVSAGRNYVWPTPSSRWITKRFSMSGNRHRGVDIWEHEIDGDDILAADGGKVIVADYRRGTSYWSYGKYVVIDHGGGYQTLYAHCSELLVKPGDTVSKGQLIAKVGNTGRSTSPHLHFEVLVNGKNVDPMLFY